MVSHQGEYYFCEGNNKSFLVKVCKEQNTRKGAKLLNDSGVTNEIITKTANHLFSLNEENLSGDAVITITQSKQGEWTYSVGDGASVSVSQIEDKDNLLDVTIRNIAGSSFPTKAKSRKRHAKEMLAKVPGGGLPFIRHLWKLVIVPLSVVIRCACPDRIYDVSTLSLKENAFARFALEDTLDDVIEIAGEDEKVRDSFQPGLVLAREWRKENADHQLLAGTAGNIIVNLNEGESFSLPAGYSAGGSFSPSLWTFHKKDGVLLLTQITYGPTREEALKTYRFGDPIDAENVQKIITKLMDMSNEKILNSTIKEKNNKEVKDKSTSPSREEKLLEVVVKKKVDNSEASGEDIQKHINDFIELNGAPLEIVDGADKQNPSFGKVVTDPVKLIEKTIAELIPGLDFADKARLTFFMLQNRTAKILKALPDMSQEQKLYWLNLLESEYLKLERQLGKKGTTWGGIKGCFDGLLAAAATCRAEQEEHNSNRLPLLDRVKNEKSDLLIDHSAISPIEKTQKKHRVSSPSVEQLRLINETEGLFAGADAVVNLPTITANMTTLVNQLDDFLNNHQYDAAMQLGHMLMPLLPGLPTTIPSDGFWGALEASDGLGSEEIRARSNQIQELSDLYARFGRFFWEAKIQTKEPGLRPDEIVFMMEMSANFQQVLSSRKALLEKISEEQRSFEEAAITKLDLDKAFIAYDCLDEVLSYRFFRLFEHPVLGKRTRSLQVYSALRKQPGPLLLHSSDKAKEELEIKKQLIEISKGFPVNSTPENLRANFPADKENPNGAYIPNVVADMSLQYLYFTSFLKFESCFSSSWLLGFSAISDEGIEALSYHRLNVNPSHFFGVESCKIEKTKGPFFISKGLLVKLQQVEVNTKDEPIKPKNAAIRLGEASEDLKEGWLKNAS